MFKSVQSPVYTFLLFLLLFLLVAALPLQASSGQQRVYIKNVIIRGNYAVDRKTLLPAVNLEEGQYYSFQRIQQAVSNIKHYYHKHGYTVAKIRSARVDLDGNFRIRVAEGKIHAIRIINNNVYFIYSMKKDLRIKEGDVFNEEKIKKELKKFKDRLNVREFNYYFRKSEQHEGQVILYIDAERYSTRLFSYSLKARWLALMPGIKYENSDFWGLDHEIRLYSALEIEVWDIRSGTSRLEYYPPSFLGKKFRPYLRLQRDTQKLKRDRINLRYAEENITLGLYMEDRLNDRSSLKLGFLRNFYQLEDFGRIETEEPLHVSAFHEGHYYYNGIQFGFSHLDPEEHYRKDKAFEVELSLDFILPDDSRNFIVLNAEVKKSFDFGFDCLAFRYFQRIILPGNPFYFDIDAARRGLHGYDHDIHYTRKLFLLNTEYLLSLHEESVKLLFMLDIALYRPVQYLENGESRELDYAFQHAFGEGLALNYSEFTFRAYYAFPFRKSIREGRFHLSIRKVF